MNEPNKTKPQSPNSPGWGEVSMDSTGGKVMSGGHEYSETGQATGYPPRLGDPFGPARYTYGPRVKAGKCSNCQPSGDIGACYCDYAGKRVQSCIAELERYVSGLQREIALQEAASHRAIADALEERNTAQQALAEAVEARDLHYAAMTKLSLDREAAVEAREKAEAALVEALNARWQKETGCDTPEEAGTEAVSNFAGLSQSSDRIAELEGYVKTMQDELAEAVKAREKAESAWQCFHCGFSTTDHAEARAHFGDDDHGEPVCLSWSNMSAEGRVAEYQSWVVELNAARDENAGLIEENDLLEHRVSGFATEIGSWFPGCTTVNQAFCQYDSMEGRALAAEEAREKAEAALVAERRRNFTAQFEFLEKAKAHIPLVGESFASRLQREVEAHAATKLSFDALLAERDEWIGHHAAEKKAHQSTKTLLAEYIEALAGSVGRSNFLILNENLTKEKLAHAGTTAELQVAVSVSGTLRGDLERETARAEVMQAQRDLRLDQLRAMEDVRDALRRKNAELETLIGAKDKLNAIQVLTQQRDELVAALDRITEFLYELRDTSPECEDIIEFLAGFDADTPRAILAAHDAGKDRQNAELAAALNEYGHCTDACETIRHSKAPCSCGMLDAEVGAKAILAARDAALTGPLVEALKMIRDMNARHTISFDRMHAWVLLASDVRQIACQALAAHAQREAGTEGKT